MKALAYDRHGSIRKVMLVKSVPKPPPPDPSSVQISVKAASLNPADHKTASGDQALLIKFSWPRVVGFDFAGKIEAVHSSETDFKVGDNVFGMINGLPQLHKGTVCEFINVPKDFVSLCPPVSVYDGKEEELFQKCAALPLVGITALKMMKACGMKAGETTNQSLRVLITGGSGGVGTMAIQLIHKYFEVPSSNIYTTVRGGTKTELCKKLGAGNCLDYTSQTPWDSSLVSSSFDQLFDVVLDLTDEASKCCKLLKPRHGRLCSILAGPTKEALREWIVESRICDRDVTVGVKKFLFSDVGGKAFELFSGARKLKQAADKRGCEFYHVIGTGNKEMTDLLATLLIEKKIEAVIDTLYSIDDAVEAITYQSTGIKKGGKVVISI